MAPHTESNEPMGLNSATRAPRSLRHHVWMQRGLCVCVRVCVSCVNFDDFKIHIQEAEVLS